jgi:hypothetical protein
MMRSILAVSAPSLILCSQSFAGIVGYHYSGTAVNSTGSNISVGDSYIATFGYDTSATGTVSGNSETYPLPADFQLTVDGVTINAANVTTDTLKFENVSGGAGTAELDFPYEVATCNQSGQPISPINLDLFFGKTRLVVLFRLIAIAEVEPE